MHFGPAGNSRRFYDEGFKKTEQAPEWLARQGLDAFEYPMGRGVNLSEPSARAIGRAAKTCGIRMSVHAPYFINCASADPSGREKSVDYLLKASRAADWLGATRVVFHIGSPGKLDRAEAFRLSLETVARARSRMDEEGLSEIALCPETMGRPSQMGSLDEVLELFGGRTQPVMSHLIETGRLTREDVEAARRLLDEAEKEESDKRSPKD